MKPRRPRVSPFHRYSHTDYLHNDFFLLLVFVSSVLHGLSTQQVPRQQCIDLGGTPHDASLLSTRGSPQAGVLLHTAPQQLSARLCSASQATAAAAVVVVVPVGRVADGVGGSGPSHPRLIGARRGLPAGGSAQRLALCKEAVHFLFPSKLCQDGGVPEHAPGWRGGEEHT